MLSNCCEGNCRSVDVWRQCNVVYDAVASVPAAVRAHAIEQHRAAAIQSPLEILRGNEIQVAAPLQGDQRIAVGIT